MDIYLYYEKRAHSKNGYVLVPNCRLSFYLCRFFDYNHANWKGTQKHVPLSCVPLLQEAGFTLYLQAPHLGKVIKMEPAPPLLWEKNKGENL